MKDPDLLRSLHLELEHEPCELCGLRVGRHLHHIVFRSQGGNDERANLRWLCRECHDEQHGV